MIKPVLLFSFNENGNYRFKHIKTLSFMNKKSIIVIIAITAIAVGAIVASKAILGDSKIGLPAEEGTENMLHVQESNNTSHVQQPNQTASVRSTNNAESGEAGP